MGPLITPYRSWLRLALIAIVIAIAVYRGDSALDSPLEPVSTVSADGDRAASKLQRLFDERRSGVVVEGSGTVAKILPDDTQGSRHQRFILEVGRAQTLLISHNIDLAPRVDDIREGDTIRFRGQYEWNERGGVIHWTHHDPDGRRPGGWIRHHGRAYR